MELGIESLIAGGETYTVEFKSDVNDEELTEAVVCLSDPRRSQCRPSLFVGALWLPTN